MKSYCIELMYDESNQDKNPLFDVKHIEDALDFIDFVTNHGYEVKISGVMSIVNEVSANDEE